EVAGIKVILRWNNSYATSDGGTGTYPERVRHQKFIDWCSRNIKNTKGVAGHIIGNEPNNPSEAPFSNGTKQFITPDDICKIFKGIRQEVGDGFRLSPPAIDPTNAEMFLNAEGEEPLTYFSLILDGLRADEVDFYALHAYSYGSTQRVDKTYEDT